MIPEQGCILKNAPYEGVACRLLFMPGIAESAVIISAFLKNRRIFIILADKQACQHKGNQYFVSRKMQMNMIIHSATITDAKDILKVYSPYKEYGYYI